MSSAVVLNDKFEKSGEAALPESFEGINGHNLYIYVKSYMASLRADTAHTKTKGEVRGGGKKPKAQKGSGGARAGSIRSPLWVGGGTTFGPRTGKNYNQKVNKKQKKLAFKYALNAHAANGSLYVVDSIEVASGKTKEAAAILAGLEQRDFLIVKESVDEKSFMAFRNLKNCYVVDQSELNGYLLSAFRAVIVEKSVFENITKEG
jgi:large subunit ribosomal protein L4